MNFCGDTMASILKGFSNHYLQYPVTLAVVRHTIINTFSFHPFANHPNNILEVKNRLVHYEFTYKILQALLTVTLHKQKNKVYTKYYILLHFILCQLLTDLTIPVAYTKYHINYTWITKRKLNLVKATSEI